MSTKVGRLLVPATGSVDGADEFYGTPTLTRMRDYSRDGVLRSLEDSLQRLGLDRVDIALIHDPDDFLSQAADDAYPALDMAGMSRLQYASSVRVIPVRCLGSVNSILIADAVSRGFDGVALLGCRSGDDYQCHFIRGSELLQTRMTNVRETLDRLALEAERVQVMEVAISDAHRIPALLDGFVEAIKRIGPNPMKGF